MSEAITAYLDTFGHVDQTPGPVLYIVSDERGPLMTLTPSGEIRERFRLPDSAEELRTQDEVVKDVSNALYQALGKKGTKAVRKVIGETLRELGLAKDDADWWLL